MLLSLLCLFTAIASFLPEQVAAGTFDNAYTFYQTYGEEMAFQSGANNEGEIYFATRGKKASTAGTQYTTIGWKVTIKNSAGSIISTLYYDLGGSNVSTVNTQLISGYEYSLYKVTLNNMRSRISASANEELRKANCSIVFDACLALKVNGTIKGGMTDGGPSWGTVYTTYNGIASAAGWSSATKETLKTYFNKTVDGIFYTVNLTAGSGIDSLSGAGRYCFGTTVTISASTSKNYTFSSWSGSAFSGNSSYSFVIYGNVSFTANATKTNLIAQFFRGDETSSAPSGMKTYYNDVPGQTLPDFGWKKIGFHQVGWSLTKNSTTATYTTKNIVIQSWIDSYIPSVNLYAVWKENAYEIVYDGNGGEGNIATGSALYSGTITMPEDGFTRDGFCVCGWSTSPDAKEPEYKEGEEVKVADIAKALGKEYSSDCTLTLYAVWDNAPVIECENIYVSLEDAKNGLVTEEWLAKYVIANDIEDGEICFGENETNSFLITDYLNTDFCDFEKEGSVTETFCATDSAGNCVKKMITIHIVDTTVYDANMVFGRVRFISDKYYKDASGNFVDAASGGLMDNSVWRFDETYTALLDQLLN